MKLIYFDAGNPQKKKELDNRIAFALQAGKYEDAKKILEELEKLLQKYNG